MTTRNQLIGALVIGIAIFGAGRRGPQVARGQASGGVVINEFMATNGSVAPLEAGELLDADGDSSDWIEICNRGTATVDLGGWYLTDDADDLTQWRFPDGTRLSRGGFLVVFASGKDRTTGELHTNFKLSADGEYLALVTADGTTVVHEYRPRYPEQLTGVSYGLGRHGGVFVSPGDLVSYRIPGASDSDTAWTTVGFNDADWATAPTGLGFVPVAELTGGDIGNPQIPGSYFINDETYVVQSNGTSMGGTGDSLHFVCAPLCGDGELTVYLADMIAADDWAKAGVMIRQSLTTGSPYAAAVLTADNGAVFEARDAEGAEALTEGDNAYDVPLYLRIIRRGDTFTGYCSLDGVNWILQGSATVDMGPDVYIGLCSAADSSVNACIGIFQELAFRSAENEALLGQMAGVSTTLRTRMAFDADETDFFDSLELAVQYEDGFVAFLNGVEVARDNVSGTPRYDSVADSDRADALRAEPMVFDLSADKDLLRDGRNVLAIAAVNDDAADETFFISAELTASGDVFVPQYFATPTPGQTNDAAALEIVAEPQPSHPRGFCDESFLLTFSCDTPAATIRYTTDGTDPTQTSGLTYAGPITIDGTTCLKVAAFRPGWMASTVETHTYLFLDQILDQPKTPAGFPTRWGGTTADYEMDPDVVEAPAYRDLMRASLLSLPALSIVSTTEDLFGTNGIHSNPWGEGTAWERPASVEWIDPDGTTGFQVNAGLRVYGGAFRGYNLTRKKSFRLLFKRQYGPTKLNFDMFKGQDAVTSFDMIVLRAGANDAWNDWGRDNTQYIIDEYMRRTQLALGHPSPHGTFVHLYLNGLYWGLYNAVERPVESFCAAYFGGEKEDWDALNRGEARGDSTTATWNTMLSQARAGLTDVASYQKIQGNHPDGTPNPAYNDLLDMDNYIDYMFCNFWGGTGDWPGHNYYAACRRPPNATGFKFFNWDSEGAIVVWSSLNTNVTGVTDGAAQPYAALRDNPEFRLRFGDHVQKHMFDGGPATSEASYARYKELADQVELAIIAESARWGDQSSSTPYTLVHWRRTRDNILNTYMPQRPRIVLDQLRDAGLYPNVEAPTFGVGGATQHGGHVTADDAVWLYGSQGTVYYTTDGSDPRLPAWNSGDTGLVTLMTEEAPKRVLVPSTANGGDQLGNIAGGFTVTFHKANITVGSLSVAEQVIANPLYQTVTATEQAATINYFNTGSLGHFDDDQPFPGTQLNVDVEDFVVLVTGTVVIPTAGEWTFGVSSDDGFGMTLTSNRHAYSCSYPDPRSPAATLETFDIAEAGAYELRLVFYERGGGSELELFVANGRYTTFSAMRFHLVGDIAGGGLQVGQGDVWFANAFDDSNWTAGTGGVGYEQGSGSYPNYFDIDVGDEMYNALTSCYIRIPFAAENVEYSNMILRVRYDDGFVAYLNGTEVARRNFTGEPAWNSNASSTNSDDAAVSLASIDISDHVGMLWKGTNVLAIHGLNYSTGSSDFLISAELVAGEVSVGEVSPTAVPCTDSFTLPYSMHIRARALAGQWSALSEATFAVGPVAESLRISEVMYHPAGDPNTEYVELTNVGAATINLNLVAFTEGIDFVFPNTELAPGAFVLVVRDVNAFEAKYGPDLPIAGRYDGSLDNAGEQVELQDAAGQAIHTFEYSDNWYDLTDGAGFSLTVRSPATIGEPNALDAKDAWRASVDLDGSPGFDDAGEATEPGAVVINEIMADAEAGGPDWIELYNTTDEAIDLGGWFLSDDGDDLTRYEIAAGTTIAAGEYLVFYEDLHFGNDSDPGCLVPFALSRKGETVYLHSGADGVLTGYNVQEKFDACETGVAQGRYFKSTGAINFVALVEPTPGAANAEAKVGPVVISEIMYNPFGETDAEYVELLNISDEAVTLYDADRAAPWRFTDDPDNPGIELLFPSDAPVVLAPGECLIVTKDLASFKVAYVTVPDGVQVFAWGEGKLANGSEKVQLSKPGDADEDEPTWIRIDRVVYSDGAHPEDFTTGVDPWPVAADGFGGSLIRIDPTAYGNDPANWQAAAPTPGWVE